MCVCVDMGVCVVKGCVAVMDCVNFKGLLQFQRGLLKRKGEFFQGKLYPWAKSSEHFFCSLYVIFRTSQCQKNNRREVFWSL